jgi:hypothetical protein
VSSMSCGCGANRRQSFINGQSGRVRVQKVLVKTKAEQSVAAKCDNHGSVNNFYPVENKPPNHAEHEQEE